MNNILCQSLGKVVCAEVLLNVCGISCIVAGDSISMPNVCIGPVASHLTHTLYGVMVNRLSNL